MTEPYYQNKYALLDINDDKKWSGIWWGRFCRGIRNGRNGGHCEVCLQQVKREELECHHIIPVCQGGEDVIWNIKLVCHDCHEKIHLMGKYSKMEKVAV